MPRASETTGQRKREREREKQTCLVNLPFRKSVTGWICGRCWSCPSRGCQGTFSCSLTCWRTHTRWVERRQSTFSLTFSTFFFFIFFYFFLIENFNISRYFSISLHFPSQTHPDFADLNSAVKGMAKMAEYLNEKKKDAENSEILLKVEEEIEEALPFSLLDATHPLLLLRSPLSFSVSEGRTSSRWNEVSHFLPLFLSLFLSFSLVLSSNQFSVLHIWNTHNHAYHMLIHHTHTSMYPWLSPYPLLSSPPSKGRRHFDKRISLNHSQDRGRHPRAVLSAEGRKIGDHFLLCKFENIFLPAESPLPHGKAHWLWHCRKRRLSLRRTNQTEEEGGEEGERGRGGERGGPKPRTAHSVDAEK